MARERSDATQLRYQRRMLKIALECLDRIGSEWVETYNAPYHASETARVIRNLKRRKRKKGPKR